MCRNTISINWEGKIFDCDFNQQLLMGSGTQNKIGDPKSLPPVSEHGLNIFEIDSLEDLHSVNIVLAAHCFGCTAGKGSSCQGATVQ